MLGGGDVKLLAASALWTGSAALLPFLTATALAGGLLAAVFLVFARRGGRRVALPYGVAIAAGGLLVTGGGLWS
jgi:prepilin peptidase CpaA